MGLLSTIRNTTYPGEGKLNQQEFTASGTWTRPTNVNIIYVTALGGGGGANSAGSSSVGGSGGLIYKVPMTVFGNVTVTVGAGGAGVSSNPGTGGQGGNTSVGVYVASGGGGGAYSTGGGNSAGANGGTNIISSEYIKGYRDTAGVYYDAGNTNIFGCYYLTNPQYIDKINGNYVLVGGSNLAIAANCGMGGIISSPTGSSGYVLIEWFT